MCIGDSCTECGTRETRSALWELETRAVWSLPSRLPTIQVGNGLTVGGSGRAEGWVVFESAGVLLPLIYFNINFPVKYF